MPKIESIDEYRRRTLESVEDYRRNTLDSTEDYLTRDAEQIRIGFEKDGKFYLDLEKLKYHLHVIGLTGTGKSFFLDLLCQQLLHLGRGFCLIDPLGFLYQSVLNFISHNPEYADKVIFFDPTRPSDYMVGYNPIKPPPEGSLMAHVSSLVDSMIKTFETDPVIATRLDEMLTYALLPTIKAGLTASELAYFGMADRRVRDAILARADDPEVDDFWFNDFDPLPHKDRRSEISSYRRRISKFARSEMVCATLGQTTNTIDIPDIVENGKILLVNLQETEWLSQRDAYLIGTLLLNDFYHYALKRKKAEAEAKRYYLIIDEVQHFLTPNAAKMLETCRQKGLHMVLAHQHLGQLYNDHMKPRDAIYKAVMSVARNKIIFGTYPDDAEQLARFFAPEWPLDEVKQRLYRTTVLNYELEKHILEGWADIDSDTLSDSDQQGEARITGVTTQQGQASDPEQPGLFGPTVTQLTESVTNLENAVDSWSKDRSQAHTTSHVTSGHEALILRPTLGKELASQEFWSHAEQHFKQMQKLISLATQWAVIKLVDDDNKSHHVKIQTLIPWLEDKEKQAAALKRSQDKQPHLYLSYKERLQAWRSNTLRLGPRKEDIKVLGSKAKGVKRH